MKIIFFILALILISCSVYQQPLKLPQGAVRLVEVVRISDRAVVRQISDKDSIGNLIRIINFNEGTEGPFETLHEIRLIDIAKDKEKAPDTTTLKLSKNGMLIETDKALTDVTGRILSKKPRYFNLSISLNEFLFGAK